MKRCPITYEEISDTLDYSLNGVRKFSRQAKQIQIFPYSIEEQLTLARQMAGKLSIQGVQPKISVRFHGTGGDFIPVATGGRYIFKPQNQLFPYLPENEDLSMRLAELAGCMVPLHALIRGSDAQFIYVVKRFDRAAKKRKLAVEDFAQLAGMSRDTKYAYSVEKIINLIDQYMTFPAIEKVVFFRLFLVNYLLGNEDAHLKNYSVITREGKQVLSPCYDIVNSTLYFPKDAEESALPLKGKKRRFTTDDFFSYLGKYRLSLSEKVISNIRNDLIQIQPQWRELITNSFLPKAQKIVYQEIVDQRCGTLLS
jgi:serine/threonine-protein kinase HipA